MISPEALQQAQWRAALSKAEHPGYNAMHRALSVAAQVATSKGLADEGQVLSLLGRACSMTLRPDSRNEPFGPLMVFDGRRTSLPEDFSSEEIAFFGGIVTELDEPWLQARLADLLWLLQSDHRCALLAIDAYQQVQLNAETWYRDGLLCRERAIRLAQALRGGASDRLSTLESVTLKEFDGASLTSAPSALTIADLLFGTRLGHWRAPDIALKLETIANSADQEGDLHEAREYFEASAKWYDVGSSDEKMAKMTARAAECWASLAESRMSGEQQSNLTALALLENAIKSYRSIPAKLRGPLGGNERITALRGRISDAGEGSFGEMGVISSPSIDISDMVNEARDAVSGMPRDEALAAFARLYSGASASRLRTAATESVQRHPFHLLFSATVLSSDGRVVGKRAGMDAEDSEGSGHEAAIWSETTRDYSIEFGLAVQGRIVPAVQQLNLEHRITERDLLPIARTSPIVPPFREHFFAKGLALGFDRDFPTAIHLLVPQVEHMVRWHLKQHSVPTTVIDARGVETEVGLGALLDRPEVAKVFGEDPAFEMRALLADAFGPNLRNELAHGLLGFEDCMSVSSVYCWWWCFRLVFLTSLQAKSSTPTGHQGPDAPESP